VCDNYPSPEHSSAPGCGTQDARGLAAAGTLIVSSLHVLWVLLWPVQSCCLEFSLETFLEVSEMAGVAANSAVRLDWCNDSGLLRCGGHKGWSFEQNNCKEKIMLPWQPSMAGSRPCL
jgi:hypothetical protein